MLADERLEPLGPLSLTLLLIHDVVVMFDYLLNGLPILLYHPTHIDCTFSHLMFHVASLLFLLELFLR